MISAFQIIIKMHVNSEWIKNVVNNISLKKIFLLCVRDYGISLTPNCCMKALSEVVPDQCISRGTGRIPETWQVTGFCSMETYFFNNLQGKITFMCECRKLTEIIPKLHLCRDWQSISMTILIQISTWNVIVWCSGCALCFVSAVNLVVPHVTAITRVQSQTAFWWQEMYSSGCENKLL